MTSQLVPGFLRKAIELLEADPARAWTVGEIAFRADYACLP